MRIEFPLLSILSVGLFLFFALQGGDVELYSWEVEFSLSPDEVRMTIDPAFAVWVPQSIVHSIGCNAFTCGNVMVLDRRRHNNRHGTYLLACEGNHIEQFRALGLFAWPAQFFINIEPSKDIVTNWSDPCQCDRTMWLPPDWWIDQWHFITVSFTSF